MKNIKNLLANRHVLFILAFSWTLIIGYLCLIESIGLPIIAIGNFDKLVHFTFHFVFTFLWFLYFANQKKSKLTYKLIFITLLLSIFYGIFIEWAQQEFTLSRKEDFFDVLANTIGGCFGIFVSLSLKRKLRK